MKRGLNFVEKIILLAVFFVIIAGLGVTAIHFTIGKKLDVLESENKTLKEQYDTLMVYLENRDMYLANTIENNKKLLDLADTFPADITKKSTLVKYDELLEKYELDSATLTLNDCEEIIAIPTSYEGVDYNLSCKCVPVDVSYSIHYSTLKDFIYDLKDLGQKVCINSISISKDATTGKVSGVLNTTEYAVSGGRKIYEDPIIETQLGIDAIFDDSIVEEGGHVSESTSESNTATEVEGGETNEETTE